MKLKNLLFGTMVALAFTACSNDENDGPNPEVKGDATFQVKVADAIMTKAGDADINSLQVLVFNGTTTDAPLEVIGSLQSGSVSTEMALTAGSKQVLVLANRLLDPGTLSTDKNSGTKLSEILAKKLTGPETDAALSMNSGLINVAIQMGKKHHYGFDTEAVAEDVYYSTGKPIKLYRNVARVKLNSIKWGDRITGSTQYQDASFRVDSVYILHGNQSTLIAGKDGEEWGPTGVTDIYLNGREHYSYESEVFKAIESSKHLWEPTYKNDYTGMTLGTGGQSKYTFNGQGDEKCEFYVYERLNTPIEDEVKTLLVVAGEFKYKMNNPDWDKVTPEKEFIVDSAKRYYTLAIGETGFTGGTYTIPSNGTNSQYYDVRNTNTFSGVLRNFQYAIDLTINGPGYDDDKGGDSDQTLDVQVQVVEWGYVEQPVDIE